MERDELAHVIDRVIENESHLDLFAIAWPIASAIIAAGWRKVPDDCAVVRREDVSVIVEHWLMDVDEHFQPYDKDRDNAILNRLRQAIADQKENDDN